MLEQILIFGGIIFYILFGTLLIVGASTWWETALSGRRRIKELIKEVDEYQALSHRLKARVKELECRP